MKYSEVPAGALPRTFLEHSNDWLKEGYGAAPHGFPPSDLRPAVAEPKPAHFYHLFAGHLGWERIAEEHFDALRAARYDGAVHVGIIGSVIQRLRVRAWLDYAWPGWVLAAEADYGYEQVTHRALHEHVQSVPCNAPVLYAHTKGAWRPSEHQDLWRRCMQDTCVTNWERCVAMLASGYDSCGAHYLPVDGKTVGVPMWAGNYWWATSGYLAGLPHPRQRDRYDAEAWVGLGGMKVHDFVPAGWPVHPHALE